jgi:hypothetical protein
MQNLLKSLVEKIWPENDSQRREVIAKNKVLIGKIGGKDAYLTYFYRKTNRFEDYIVFNVVFGHREVNSRYTQELGDFKQFETEFVLINENDVKVKEYEYMKYDSEIGNFLTSVMLDIDFFDNFEELIYQECSKEESIELSKKISDLNEQERKITECSLQNKRFFAESNFLNELYKNGRYDERLEKEFIKYSQMTEEEYQQEAEEMEKLFAEIDFSAIISELHNKMGKQK